MVYHYKIEPVVGERLRRHVNEGEAAQLADQLLSPLRGLLEREIAKRGGVEGYMRWVRSEERTG